MADTIVLGVRLTGDGRELVGAVTVSEEALRKLRGETESNTDVARKLNQEQKNLAGALNQSAFSIGAYTAAWSLASNAILGALEKAKDYIKEIALLNARHETLGVVMGVVGRNAGYSAAQMNEAAEGVRKMGITMVESRQAVVNLAQSNIDLAQATKLARVAQDAAVIGNLNSSEAMQRMIYGITSGQTEVLRTIGINVNFEQSYKSLAKQLGVTTEQLTEQEKVQARANVVLEAGKAIYGSYEAAMGTAGKQLNSLARYEEDLKVLRGQVFNDALVIAVNAYTDSLKDANSEARRLSDNNKLQEWGRDMIMVLAYVADKINTVVVGWKAVFAAVELVGAKAAQMTTTQRPGETLRQAQMRADLLVTDYEDKFGRAVDELGARTKTPFTDSAREWLSTRDADREQRAREDRDEGFDSEVRALVGRRNQTDRPGGKATGGADMADYVRQLERSATLTQESTELEKVLYDLREKQWKIYKPELAERAIAAAKELDSKKELEKLFQMELGLRRAAAAEEAEIVRVRVQLGQQAQQARNQLIDSSLQAQRASQDELELAQFEISLMGRSDAERRVLVAGLKAELDARRQLKDMKGLQEGDAERFTSRARETAEAQANAANLREQANESKRFWTGIADDINRALTDSIMRGFESGQSIARNFGESVKRYFMSLAISIPIRFISNTVTGALASAFPEASGLFGGNGNGGGGGFNLSNMSSLTNMLPGGNPFSNMLGGLFGGAGAAAPAGLGAGMASTASLFGAGGAGLGGLSFAGGLGASGVGLSTAGMIGAEVGLGAGLASTAGAGLAAGSLGGATMGAGAAAAGMGAAAAIPYVGLVIAAASLLGMGKKKTPTVGIGMSIANGSAGYYGGLNSDIIGYGDRGGQRETWLGSPFAGGFESQIQGQYDEVANLGKQLGLNTAGLRNVRVSGVSSQMFKENQTEVLPEVLDQVSRQLATSLIPNFDKLAQAGESATDTLKRMVNEMKREQVVKSFGRMNAALGLEDSTRDLWLSDLSPLTARERLDQSSRVANEYAAAARGGDIAAFGKYAGAMRGNLQEASRFYGTSTAEYPGIFDSRQAESAGIVSGTLTGEGAAFNKMNFSLSEIVGLLKDVDVRIANALAPSLAAAKIRDAAAAKAVVQAVVAAAPALAPAWIDDALRYADNVGD